MPTDLLSRQHESTLHHYKITHPLPNLSFLNLRFDSKLKGFERVPLCCKKICNHLINNLNYFLGR